ncbi:MAG: hypothetical protein ACTSSG_07345 [Candidatus Heimdallarchaeaceae archaeon]
MLPRIYNIARLRDFILKIAEKYNIINYSEQFITIDSYLLEDDPVVTYFANEFNINCTSLNKHYFHGLLFLNLGKRVISAKGKKNNSKSLIKLNVNKISPIFKIGNLGKNLLREEKNIFRNLLLNAHKIKVTAVQDRQLKSIPQNSNYFLEIIKEIQKYATNFNHRITSFETNIIYESDVEEVIKKMFLEPPEETTLKSEKRTFNEWGMTLNFLVYICKAIAKRYLSFHKGFYFIPRHFPPSYEEIIEVYKRNYISLKKASNVVELPVLNILTMMELRISYDDFYTFFKEFLRRNKGYVQLHSYIPSTIEEKLRKKVQKWAYDDKYGYYHSISISKR